MVDVNTATTAEAHRESIAREYGQFVATEPITIDGALAFNVGHPVPAGHVKKYGLEKAGAVRKVNTAAAAGGEEKKAE